MSAATSANAVPALVDRYNEGARDYTRWWAPVLERAARKLVDYVEWYSGAVPAAHGTVLELGTGSGNLASAALARWPTVQVVASDVAAGMLEVAREQLVGATGSRLRFIEAPASQVPMPDGSVDLVISSFVLQLVPDRLAALREARRLLRPGGVVAYVTWIDRSDTDFEPSIEFDEAVLDLGVEEPTDEGGPFAGDIRSVRSAWAQMRRAGLDRVRVREDRLEYDWTMDTYLDYKLSYDERTLMATLTDKQREKLERRVRQRLSKLKPEAFRWRPPIVFAAGTRPR